MALVLKMKEGDKTPTLYTHYGKQYEFDELQRSADVGFNDFLSGLKRGEKDQDKFREAYSNIMAGIKDGTITFKDGRYYDSLGRYTNSREKNKNKDYYGLVANYIYNKQGKSKEYIKPEDQTDTRIKWNGNTGVGQAFLRNIYGSDKGNIADFWDLDPYNKETNSRSLAGRLSKTKSGLEYLYNNFDSLFTGYSDSDKTQALSNLRDAIDRTSDSTIDAGDYLALSKALGGLDFRNMFITDEGKSVEQQTSQEEQQGVRNQPGFLKWVQQKYPQFTGQLNNPISMYSSRTYNQDTWDKLRQAIGKATDRDLFYSLQTSLRDNAYNIMVEPYMGNVFIDSDPGFTREFSQLAILNALKNRNLLHSFGTDNPNLYYIPNTEGANRQTAWVWDSQNNTISEMSYHDIPYWRDKIYNEWLTTQGANDPSGYYSSRYQGYRFQNGGIIKAQFGTVMKRGQKDNWLSIDNTYKNAKDVSTWDNYYNNTGIDQDVTSGNPWQSGYLKDSSGKIITDQNGNVQYGLSADQLGELLNNLNAVGSNLSWDKKANSRGYDQWNRIFDQTGLNTYFGGDSNRFDYLGPSTWNRHALLQRMQQAHGKDNPLKVGDNSLYFDDGKWGILPVEEPPSVVEQPQPETPETQKETKEETEKETLGSYVNPINITNKRKDLTNLRQTALGFIPEVIGAGRLFDSLRTNNRVSETIRKALNPVLKDTYELYSPITGAFSEMQFRNRQAANIRRVASRPITSDASLALAGNLDANRQASDLEYQGFLADDKEILRTQQEALKRQEDNTARRSAVANENRSSINKTNRERAELEATRLRRNWQSRDNFLQGVEGRLRTRFEQDKERRNNFRLQTALSDVDQQYQDAIRGANNEVEAWKAKNPGVSISAMPNYRNYENFMREMSNWKNAQTYKSHAGVYGYSYDNAYLNKSPREIATSYNYYKQGGQLRPSTLHLINKVIKDENIT